MTDSELVSSPLYPNYRFSPDGKIYTKYQKKEWREMAAQNNTSHMGYKVLKVYVGGKRITKEVHRIIAEVFIPNPNNLPCVNHKDEDIYNNNVSNLEWCTYLYNNMYGTAKSRMKKTRIENDQNRAIDMYDMKGNLLKHYETAYHIERDGLSRRAVYNVCNGRTKSYKGCIFVFHGEPYKGRELDSFPKGHKKRVVVTDTNGNVIKVYISIKQAERENNLSRNYLYSATYASTRKALINGMYFEIKTYC